MSKRLGVGFIGSGFITKFHIQSWLAVRDADILGIWSPNAKNAAEAAATPGRTRAAPRCAGTILSLFQISILPESR